MHSVDIYSAEILLEGMYLKITSGQQQDLMIICILIPQSLCCLVFVWNRAHSFNDISSEYCFGWLIRS
uniref:Uncharacterized protein n=1 Tax=Magallana gigas TaxID=29159 RepID=A0A8W8HS58_MAGGI